MKINAVQQKFYTLRHRKKTSSFEYPSGQRENPMVAQKLFFRLVHRKFCPPLTLIKH